MFDALKGQEGKTLAQRAIDDLVKRGLTPTPNAYALWTAWLGGLNPAVTQRIEARLDDPRPLTDAQVDALHEECIGQRSFADNVMETSGKMSEELAAIITHLQDAERNTSAFGEALEGATGAMTEDASAESIRSMIGGLAKATRQMQRHSQSLETKLKETTAEVEQLRTNLDAVREEALTDALTGVANRKRFDDAIAKALEGYQRGNRFALIMTDIDHFKRFNDTWGHQTGDQIIRFVAASLKHHTDPQDLVARYGGEEFAIILRDVSLEEARKIANATRQTIERKKLVKRSTGEELGHVSSSFGIAIPREGDEVWSIIERADKCLYAAKKAGRNQVITDEEFDTSAADAA